MRTSRLLSWLVVVLPLSALALTNNLALTPPMGWNDWNSYGCGISQSTVSNTAAVVAANGMRAAGYQFINIDDGWASSRDSNGVIQAYATSTKFPNGIQWLADQVHGTGLKLGVYTDHGTNTCSSCISGQTPPKQPGSYGYEYVDAFTYASWGVDYLKDDSCNQAIGSVARDDYFRMADGLMKSGRAITFSLCPNKEHYEYWSPDMGNLWRTTGDIGASFASMISKLDQDSKAAYLAGPGRWNDADMLEVGNGEFATNLVAAQSHFTMWCEMAAPLIAGNNVSTMSAATLSILTNAEAIAVDQDPAGEQGVRVGGVAGAAEIWSKPLGYDFTARAVALLNRDASNSAVITCYWTNLALQPGPATVRDLWAHADRGSVTDSFTAVVPAEGVVFLKVTGTPMVPPALGTNYLSDLQPIYAYTGWGTQTRDKSIGSNTLTLNGVTYAKGIGTHAIGGQEYDLGGVCSRFLAAIGVDDEVGANGSVIFQVLADGRKIYDSGIRTGGAPAQTVDLDLTGVRRLTLGVTDTGNDVVPGTSARNSYDHSDWAEARVVVTNTAPQAPRAPTGLAANAGNAITLTWHPALGALSYKVQRATNLAGPYTTLTNVPLTTFADSNVVPGTNYFYVVSAVSSFGESPTSTPVNAIPCNVPAPPTTVTGTFSNGVVRVTWTVSADATSYLVSRFTGSTPPAVLASVPTASFTDTNTVPGTTNYYLISAANACNQSRYSAFAPAVVPSLSVGPLTWNGGSKVGNFWSDTNNWAGATLTPGADLVFGGNARLSNTNDSPTGAYFASLTFAPNAGPFALNGNPVALGGDLANNSANPQTVNLGVSFSNSLTLGGAGGTLLVAGGLTNTFGAPGSTTLILAGTGQLINRLSSAANPGGTNILLANSPGASWTLVDNVSSTGSIVPWVLSVNNGTLNFGTASSAPTLTTTTVNNIPQDNQVGAVSGATGTFNMINGTLTTGARLNTATAANATGIVNQTGGTLNLGSQFQGANGSNPGEVSLVTVSGGSMNIGGGGGPFYVASRGTGSLTLSGSGVVNCGRLDLSRNAAGNTMSSAGTVNLDGGTLMVTSVTNLSANQQTGGSPTATFNFNGGLLSAKAGAAALFFQGSIVAPVTPIRSLVKAGGAVIDDGGNAITLAEPLQHDPALGSASDGGLTKLNGGTLTLTSNDTYNGNTTVTAGTLALSGAGSLSNSATIAVGPGATLDASGRTGSSLTLTGGQTLTGQGILRGNVFLGNGATLALGGSIGTLTFNNQLTLLGGSTTVLALSKSPIATNASVRVASNVTYGGALVLTNLGATPLAAGDSFRLFSAGSYAGVFANLVPVIPAVNLAWNTNGLTNGIVAVAYAPTPPPRFLNTTATGGGFTVRGDHGVPNWPYCVLASSNLALPLNQWRRIATNSFDNNGSFTFTNVLAPGAPTFYRLQLQ